MWVWAGGITSSGGIVAVKTDAGVSCQLVTSLSPDLASPTTHGPVSSDVNGFAKIAATGLPSDRTIHYGVRLGDTLTPTRGTFKTLPPVGASAFKIGFASCSDTSLDHPVYERIAEKDLTLFVHLGDLHYKGASMTSADAYRGAYADYFAGTRRAAMHAAMAVDYVWDDHDWGALNDGDRTWPNAEDAAAVYRQVVPHYPLDAIAPDNAIYHSYTIGRALFIVTDLRYHRDPSAQADSPSKTMLGATQKQWFKDQLLAAKTAGAPRIFWCSTSMYTSDGVGSTGEDTWGRYSYERTDLLQFMVDNDIPPVTILSGDAHQIAWSSGRIYGGVQRRIPEHVSAAMYAGLATRPGHFNFGPVPGSGHYSVVSVTDDSNGFHYSVTGYEVDPVTGAEVILYSTLDNQKAHASRGMKTWDATQGWAHRPVRAWNGTEWATRTLGAHL